MTDSKKKSSGLPGFISLFSSIQGILYRRGTIPKNPDALHRCLASVYYYTGKGCDQQKEMMCLGMVSLNSRDLGMDHSFELTGTDEREVMRKFIEYSETELKIPVLTADTIYRVQMAIKK